MKVLTTQNSSLTELQVGRELRKRKRKKNPVGRDRTLAVQRDRITGTIEKTESLAVDRIPGSRIPSSTER